MRKLILTIACGVLAAPAALAVNHVDVSGLIQPGLYQITSKMTMTGMPAGMPTMPAHTMTHCVTPDDVNHFARNMAEQVKKSKGEMQIRDLSLHGKHLHFKMVTKDGTMYFDIIFDNPTHYHETMKGMMSGDMRMTAHGTGHRIGACKPKPKD